jgi:hypothetical protein
LRPELKRRAKKAALEKSISLSALFPDAVSLLLFFFVSSILSHRALHAHFVFRNISA